MWEYVRSTWTFKNNKILCPILCARGSGDTTEMNKKHNDDILWTAKKVAWMYVHRNGCYDAVALRCTLFCMFDDDHHDGFFLLRRDYNGFCNFFFRSFWFRVSIWVPLLPCLAMHIIIALDASTNIIPETRHGNTISIWLLHRWSGSIFVCEYGDKHSVSFMWFFFRDA